MSEAKHETVDDIVAQIRAAAYVQNVDQPESVLRLADRIEAAWKREREMLMTTPRSFEECMETLRKNREGWDDCY